MTNKEALEMLEEVKEFDDSIYQYNEKYLQALNMAIKLLKQESILNKIRAEIKALYMNFTYRENSIYKASWGLRKAMEIIDKYRTEN